MTSTIPSTTPEARATHSASVVIVAVATETERAEARRLALSGVRVIFASGGDPHAVNALVEDIWDAGGWVQAWPFEDLTPTRDFV